MASGEGSRHAGWPARHCIPGRIPAGFSVGERRWKRSAFEALDLLATMIADFAERHVQTTRIATEANPVDLEAMPERGGGQGSSHCKYWHVFTAGHSVTDKRIGGLDELASLRQLVGRKLTLCHNWRCIRRGRLTLALANSGAPTDRKQNDRQDNNG